MVRSGSVVECLTLDRVVAGSSFTGVTALCHCTRHINPCLVLVQPRKTRLSITERLLIGRKESNQTKPISRERYRVILTLLFFSSHDHEVFRNVFDFWKVHGILNTSGLLQSK